MRSPSCTLSLVLCLNCADFFAEENNIPDAMRRGFLELDEDMLDDEDMKDELAGTTAICVIIKDKKIYCVSSNVYAYIHDGKFF